MSAMTGPVITLTAAYCWAAFLAALAWALLASLLRPLLAWGAIR